MWTKSKKLYLNAYIFKKDPIKNHNGFSAGAQNEINSFHFSNKESCSRGSCVWMSRTLHPFFLPLISVECICKLIIYSINIH